MSPIEELILESDWKRTRTPLIVALSFISAFLVTRAYTHLYPGSQVSLGGLHVHHINYGIILVSLSAFLSVYYVGPRVTEVSSVLLGGGLAFVVDEFWLVVMEDFGFETYWGLDLRVATRLATILAAAMFIIAYRRRYAFKEREIQRIAPLHMGPVYMRRGGLARLARIAGFHPPRKMAKPRQYAVVLAGDSGRFHREGGMLIVDLKAVSIANITSVWRRWRSRRPSGTVQDLLNKGLRS